MSIDPRRVLPDQVEPVDGALDDLERLDKIILGPPVLERGYADLLELALGAPQT